MPATSFFLSYARKDFDFTLKLAKDLKAKGFKVWMDKLDLKPAKTWDSQIEQALAKADQLMVVLTKESVKSENVLNEIAYAIKKGKEVLPVLAESVELPLMILRNQFVDFSRSYEEGLSELVSKLSEITESTTDTVTKTTPPPDIKPKPEPLSELPPSPPVIETRKTSGRINYKLISIAATILLIGTLGYIFRKDLFGTNKAKKEETIVIDGSKGKDSPEPKDPDTPIRIKDSPLVNLPPKPVETPREIYTKARRLLTEEKFNEAIQMFNKAKSEGYTDIALLKYRGICFLKTKSINNALSDFSEFLRSRPSDTSVKILRADTYFSTSQYSDARTDYNELISAHPSIDKDIIAKRGYCHYKLNELRLACNDFLTASKAGSTRGDKYYKTFCEETITFATILNNVEVKVTNNPGDNLPRKPKVLTAFTYQLTGDAKYLAKIREAWFMRNDPTCDEYKKNEYIKTYPSSSFTFKRYQPNAIKEIYLIIVDINGNVSARQIKNLVTNTSKVSATKIPQN